MTARCLVVGCAWRATARDSETAAHMFEMHYQRAHPDLAASIASHPAGRQQ